MRAAITPSDRRATWTALGLLLALWLGHVIANFVWLKLDTRPPYWDMAGHAITAINFSRLPYFTDFPTALQGLFTLGTYPPFVHLISAPLAFLSRPTMDLLTGTLAIFLGVLIFSIYGLARDFGGRMAGLLAAFIVTMYPLVYGLGRHYLLDVPLVAMVTLSIWLLVRTDEFARRNGAVVWGLSLGLGMLTKWTFVIFVAGPFLVVAVRAGRVRSRRRLLNVALAAVMATVVAAPWYLCNLRSLLEFLGHMPIYARAEGDPVVGSLESWGYYLQAFVNDQVLLPFALFFGVGLIVLLMRRKFRYETAMLMSWIAVPYLVASLLYNKDPRYTMPYLPAVAIVTALGLTLLPSRPLKRGLVALLVLYAVVQFSGLSWGLSNRLPAGVLPGRVTVQVGSASLPLYAEGVHIASPPRTEDWQVEAVLHDIGRSGESPPKAESLTLAVLSDTPGFDQNAFKYYALADRLAISIFAVTGVLEMSDAHARVLASDYIITKTGSLGPAWTTGQGSQFTKALSAPSSKLRLQFELLKQYTLPDGSIGQLYRRASWSGKHSRRGGLCTSAL